MEDRLVRCLSWNAANKSCLKISTVMLVDTSLGDLFGWSEVRELLSVSMTLVSTQRTVTSLHTLCCEGPLFLVQILMKSHCEVLVHVCRGLILRAISMPPSNLNISLSEQSGPQTYIVEAVISTRNHEHARIKLKFSLA